MISCINKHFSGGGAQSVTTYILEPVWNMVKETFAMEAGEKVTGCTVHYVTKELDSGTIIAQGEVPILPEDTVESLTKAIQRKEYALLPAVIDDIKHKIPTTTHRYML